MRKVPRSMIQAMNILFHIRLEYQGFYTQEDGEGKKIDSRGTHYGILDLRTT